MQYRLRNHELHRLLNDLTQGEFERTLEKLMNRGPEMSDLLAAASGERKLGELSVPIMIAPADIESVPHYDRTGWNRWPEVTPPDDVPMAVEYRSKWDERKIEPTRTCWVFRRGRWFWLDGRMSSDYVTDDKKDIRFTPWRPEDRRPAPTQTETSCVTWHPYPKERPDAVRLGRSHKRYLVSLIDGMKQKIVTVAPYGHGMFWPEIDRKNCEETVKAWAELPPAFRDPADVSDETDHGES